MKFLNKITLFTVLFCLACLFVVNAEEDTPPVAKRPNLLLRRPTPQRVGGPLGNKQASGGAASTTTSTTTPKSDDYNENDEYDQNEELDGEHGGNDKGDNENVAPSTTSTTTEPPKKIGPIIRPFRSNDDLLSALKRRQQNSKKGPNKVVEKPIVKDNEGEEENDEPAPAANPAPKSSERGARRNKFTAKKTAPTATNGDSEDGNNDQPASTAVKRPGRFTLKTLKSK